MGLALEFEILKLCFKYEITSSIDQAFFRPSRIKIHKLLTPSSTFWHSERRKAGTWDKVRVLRGDMIKIFPLQRHKFERSVVNKISWKVQNVKDASKSTLVVPSPNYHRHCIKMWNDVLWMKINNNVHTTIRMCRCNHYKLPKN